MEGAEALLMQKQFLCTECVLGRVLCSVLCIQISQGDNSSPFPWDIPSVNTSPEPSPSTFPGKDGQVVMQHLILLTAGRARRPINPILQMEKPELKGLEDFAQGQTAAKWQRLDLDLGLSDPQDLWCRELPKCHSAGEGWRVGPGLQGVPPSPIFSLNPGRGPRSPPNPPAAAHRASSLSLYGLFSPGSQN